MTARKRAPEVTPAGRERSPADGTGAARPVGCPAARGRLVFVLVGLFGAAVGAARTARQQARVAADFGALAGAGRALGGEGRPAGGPANWSPPTPPGSPAAASTGSTCWSRRR